MNPFKFGDKVTCYACFNYGEIIVEAFPKETACIVIGLGESHPELVQLRTIEDFEYDEQKSAQNFLGALQTVRVSQ